MISMVANQEETKSLNLNSTIIPVVGDFDDGARCHIFETCVV